MSVAATQGLKKRKVRYVRDANGHIIQIREFDHSAEVGAVCHTTIINRDATTKKIISFYTDKDIVTIDDITPTT